MKSINARKRKTRKKNRSEQNIKRNETFSIAFLLGFRAHETFLQNCKNYTTKTTTAKKTVAAVAGAAAATDKRREYNTIAILYSFLVGFVFFRFHYFVVRQFSTTTSYTAPCLSPYLGAPKYILLPTSVVRSSFDGTTSCRCSLFMLFYVSRIPGTHTTIR